MFTEAEAIPYEPANLRGERLLVLAPHPDDEVIGCGGLIALHLRERRAVRIVVATDGAEAGSRELREEETRRGVARLGDNASIGFLRYPDRALSDDAAEKIREELLSFRPDLVLVPSAVEIHPDHLALSRIFCELIQRDPALFGDLATTRVAFFEVSSTLRPNAIVDISNVAEVKYAGIAEHASQTALRDYTAYARGLNAYRTMTLPAGATAAEAYHVVELPSLRSMPFSDVRKRVGGPHEIETNAAVPVSVVVRTKDRPELLKEAVASIRATGYPCEIVVVNDGGVKPELDGVTLVHHEQSRGRAEAANAGVRAAANAYVAFLDDDDLFYPEHLATLARGAGAPVYTDAVSAFFKPGATEAHWRLRIFSHDFDRDLLLVDNYIPLPTILLQRETFLELGGFDKEFDLFEDWDFLIRLAQRGDFRHVAQVTCEIRHFEGGSSVVLAAPEGTDRFRAAKLQIWRKHAALVTQDLIAKAFETQKRRANDVYSQLVEARGQSSLFRGEIARLEREKAGLAQDVGAYMLRVRELEGTVSALSPIVEQRTAEVIALARETEALRAAAAEQDGALRHARVEVDRLNGLLDMIYRSKTWKLHTMVEKMKGRG